MRTRYLLVFAENDNVIGGITVYDEANGMSCWVDAYRKISRRLSERSTKCSKPLKNLSSVRRFGYRHHWDDEKSTTFYSSQKQSVQARKETFARIMEEYGNLNAHRTKQIARRSTRLALTSASLHT